MTNEIMNTTGTQLIIPAEYQSMVMANFDTAMDALAGTFRSISFAGKKFTLKEGGSNTTLLDNQPLIVIFLGLTPDTYFQYWSKNYKDGVDMGAPDAVWYSRTPRPANVPATAMVKDPNTGYTKCTQIQRTVVAVVRHALDGSQYIDFENPFVMDVKSQSLFGDSYPELRAYSLKALMAFCKNNRIKPCMFATQVIMDQNISVPTVKFRPQTDAATGSIQFLDNAIMSQVFKALASPVVSDLLEVKEVLGVAAPAVPATQAPVAPAAPQQFVAPAAPQQFVAPAAPVNYAPTFNNTSAGDPPQTVQTFSDTTVDLMAQAQVAMQQAQAVVAPVAATAEGALADILNSVGTYK